MTTLVVDPALTGDTTLYRYVSLKTFIAFVETRQAHFRKITEWDDPWEAFLSKIPSDAGDGLLCASSLTGETCIVPRHHERSMGRAGADLGRSASPDAWPSCRVHWFSDVVRKREGWLMVRSRAAP